MDPFHSELLGVHVPRALGIIGDVFWDVAYLLAIWMGFKQRTYCLPLLAICLNFAWEILFTIFYPPLTAAGVPDVPKVVLYGVWLVLDAVIIFQLARYGREQQTVPFLRRHFHKLLALTFATCLVGELTLFISMGRRYQDEMAYGMNLLMSVLFIAMLVGRPRLVGISQGVAWFKMLGTGLISVAYVLSYLGGRAALLPIAFFFYLTILVVDAIYVVLVRKAQAELGAGSATVTQIAPPSPPVLDRLVQAASRIRLAGRSYHPYLLMTDLALLAALATSLAFHARFGAPGPLASLGAFALTYAAYELGYLRLKRALTGVRARSASIDLLAFVIPCYLAASAVLFTVPVKAAADLLGLILPTFMAFVRLGCFLGGCCYGRPWSRGVLYRPDVVRPVLGWRRFQPGPIPATRVFPVQLMDGAINAALAIALWSHLLRAGAPTGRVLLLYLCGYGVARFAGDFVRRSSVCRRVGRLSFAQVVAVPMVAISGFVLYLLA